MTVAWTSQTEGYGGCVACGWDNCKGHDETTDPGNWLVLQAHEHDIHTMCFPEACPHVSNRPRPGFVLTPSTNPTAAALGVVYVES